MTRVGIISDTHGYLDPAVLQHFQNCDLVLHAGDFGTLAVAQELATFKPLKGVYGNVDGTEFRSDYPENLVFQIEKVKVFMTHIGGYPPKYNARVKPLIKEYKPQLFIDGHSHILKVQYDAAMECLHINPGAAGKHGWHKMRTIIRLVVDGDKMSNCEVIELGKK